MKMFLQTMVLVVMIAVAQSERCTGENCVEPEKEVTTETSKAEKKLMEGWLDDAYEYDNDRTWRWSRKALVPVLIGLGLKSLALVGLTLTILTIIGSIAIATSKLSLTISALMFLKRFFSSGNSSGGFSGLNPLNYPRPGEHSQGADRRWYITRPS